jgi:hypothetical protein
MSNIWWEIALHEIRYGNVFLDRGHKIEVQKYVVAISGFRESQRSSNARLKQRSVIQGRTSGLEQALLLNLVLLLSLFEQQL